MRTCACACESLREACLLVRARMLVCLCYSSILTSNPAQNIERQANMSGKIHDKVLSRAKKKKRMKRYFLTPSIGRSHSDRLLRQSVCAK